MRPMGGKKTYKENNSQDWRVKGKAYKKYKHMERQQAKRSINRCLKYGQQIIDNDIEIEVSLRKQQEE